MELSTSPTLAEELLEAKKGKGNLLSSYAPEKVVCASVDGPTLMCAGETHQTQLVGERGPGEERSIGGHVMGMGGPGDERGKSVGCI